MKTPNIVFSLVVSIIWLYSIESIAQVTGRVTDEDKLPLSQVHIKIQDTDLGTQTDLQGEYTIDAYPGDILVFSHVGMQDEKVRVQRNSFVINVRMIKNRVEIEEVEIQKKTTIGYKSQKELLKEYPTNKDLIKTSRGILNKNLSSTNFRIVEGKDLFPGGKDFFDALKDHIPSMRVIREESGDVVVYLRQYGINEYPAIFEVDGFIGPVPTYLSAHDIDRLAVLEGNAAFIKFGPEGSGGVIVVNTKAQTLLDDMGIDRSEEHSQFLDSAIRVTHLEPYQPYLPRYLEKLQKVRSEKKALAIVEEEQSSHLSDPHYYLEIYELFLSRWGNNDKAKELSKYIIENFPEDIPVLKALAYLQQRYAYYLEVLPLYVKILMSQSWYAQALRDVANAYREIGDNEKAWFYYTQYINILDQLPNASFDPYGEDELIATEMMNILEQNNEAFFDRDTIATGIDDFGPQTRLVFEWNNPEAEFELQFVSPEGYYDTWSNKADQYVSQNLIADKGYTSHQFFLGKENIGLWQINIDYKGNNSEMPTYIKVSVYRDYGLPNQQSEISIYKMSGNHEKVQLFTFEQSNIPHL